MKQNVARPSYFHSRRVGQLCFNRRLTAIRYIIVYFNNFVHFVHPKRSHTKPHRTGPNQAKPSQTKPNQAKPSHTKPHQATPSHTRANQTWPQRTSPCHATPRRGMSRLA
jgi:hypothetical protein